MILHTRTFKRGGVLGVGFQRTSESVTDLYLEGPVETVFRGTLEV